MSTVQNSPATRNSNPAPRGGQHTLGSFGYASFTAPAPGQPTTYRPDDQPRRVGGLTFGQRRAHIRVGVMAAAITARKGQSAAVVSTTVEKPAPSPVAVAFAARCNACPLASGFDEMQFQAWCDARYAEAVAHQDEFDGAGLAAACTPAMQRAAAESEREDQCEWQELADLAACPEWDRHAVEPLD